MIGFIPSHMKGVVVYQNGGPEVLEYKTDLPIPSCQENQVLVHNSFSAINYIDTYLRTGLYAAPKPEILGKEASGTVAAVGSGPNQFGFRPGDRVVWLGNGGYGEYTTVAMEKTIKIPQGISDEDAVGGFMTGMTALSLVRESYPVQKRDWVLLHAAAGGVGLVMCQILRHMGAKVIGTAGGREKCELAKQNGADYMVDYNMPGAPNFVEEVKRLTNGVGVHVVFDSVGKDTWEGSMEAVRRKGSVVFYGNSSGPVPPFSVGYVSIPPVFASQWKTGCHLGQCDLASQDPASARCTHKSPLSCICPLVVLLLFVHNKLQSLSSRLCLTVVVWFTLSPLLYSVMYLLIQGIDFPYRKLAAKNIHIARPNMVHYITTREEFEYYANDFFRQAQKRHDEDQHP